MALVGLIVTFILAGTDYLYNRSSPEVKKRMELILIILYYSIALILICIFLHSFLSPNAGIVLPEVKFDIEGFVKTGQITDNIFSWYIAVSLLLVLCIAKTKLKFSLFDCICFLVSIFYICWQIPTFPYNGWRSAGYFVIGVILEFLCGVKLCSDHDEMWPGLVFTCCIGIIMFVLNCIIPTRISSLATNFQLLIFGAFIMTNEILALVHTKKWWWNLSLIVNIIVLILYIESNWGIVEACRWVYSFMSP